MTLSPFTALGDPTRRRVLQQSSGYAFLRIAETCRAHGRDDLALDWAERGRAAFPGELRLLALLVDLHTAAGRASQALDAARELFTRAPSLDAHRRHRV